MEYYRQSSADTLHALDSTPDGLTPVSYTHLTLPTNSRV